MSARKITSRTRQIRTRAASLPPPPPPPPPILHPYLSDNALVCADNLDTLRELPDECVALIYATAPFNSNHNYLAALGAQGRVDAQRRDIRRWTVEPDTQYQPANGVAHPNIRPRQAKQPRRDIVPRDGALPPQHKRFPKLAAEPGQDGKAEGGHHHQGL